MHCNDRMHLSGVSNLGRILMKSLGNVSFVLFQSDPDVSARLQSAAVLCMV